MGSTQRLTHSPFCTSRESQSRLIAKIRHSPLSTPRLSNKYTHDKMPPKKQEKQGGGKKPSATKIVEDRTFGMKNKKGAQTQKQIAQMTQSAKAGGTPEEKRRAAEKSEK